MKRSEYFFSALLVPVDATMVFVAGLLAYTLRFDTIAEIRPVLYTLDAGEYRELVLAVALIYIVVFALSGLYAMRATRRLIDEIGKIITSCSTAILIVITVIFFQRELFSSRFIILIGFLLSIFFVTLGRIIVRAIQSALLSHGFGVRSAIVVGSDETTRTIMRYFAETLSAGYRVVRHYERFDENAQHDVDAYRQQHPLDVIIQGDPRAPKEDSERLIEYSLVHHVTFKFSADVFNTHMSNIGIGTVAGIPLFEIRRTRLEGWGRIVKRIFDIVLSALGLLILSPLFLIVGVIVVADSAGKPFVALQRVGKQGKVFTLYKFRSMVRNAHAMKQQLMQYNERSDGPLFKMQNDPRITRVGAFLRRTSIDELPQLWNVLTGSMSLVGPRPHEPEEVQKYSATHHQLLQIQPGITGMAQVSGRSNLSFDEEVKLDLYYSENWSLKHDLQILFRTSGVVFRRRGVA